MGCYRAAILRNGEAIPELLMRHRAKTLRTVFLDRSAALRALDRAATKVRANGCRGFLWPVSAGHSLTTADLARGVEIPAYVETVAL